jgi:hypothetical protein
MVELLIIANFKQCVLAHKRSGLSLCVSLTGGTFSVPARVNVDLISLFPDMLYHNLNIFILYK